MIAPAGATNRVSCERVCRTVAARSVAPRGDVLHSPTFVVRVYRFRRRRLLTVHDVSPFIVATVASAAPSAASEKAIGEAALPFRLVDVTFAVRDEGGWDRWLVWRIERRRR